MFDAATRSMPPKKKARSESLPVPVCHGEDNFVITDTVCSHYGPGGPLPHELKHARDVRGKPLTSECYCGFSWSAGRQVKAAGALFDLFRTRAAEYPFGVRPLLFEYTIIENIVHEPVEECGRVDFTCQLRVEHTSDGKSRPLEGATKLLQFEAGEPIRGKHRFVLHGTGRSCLRDFSCGRCSQFHDVQTMQHHLAKLLMSMYRNLQFHLPFAVRATSFKQSVELDPVEPQYTREPECFYQNFVSTLDVEYEALSVFSPAVLPHDLAQLVWGYFEVAANS